GEWARRVALLSRPLRSDAGTKNAFAPHWLEGYGFESSPIDESAMSRVILLCESGLRACVALDVAAIDCVEQAFRRLATENVIMPPILRLDIAAHNGEVDVKTAYLPGLDSFAIKVSPGFFDNPK